MHRKLAFLFPLLILIGYILYTSDKDQRTSLPVVHTYQQPIEHLQSPVVSPDGGYVAYTKDAYLHVRDLATETDRRITDSEGAEAPFWSPDSESLGYVVRKDGALNRVSVLGGTSTFLCKLPYPDFFAGAVWTKERTILISQAQHGLYQVASTGGATQKYLSLDEVRGESWFLSPAMMPDGETLILSMWTKGYFELVAIRQKIRYPLFREKDQSMVDRPVFASTGHLVFDRSHAERTSIWAMTIEPATLEIPGAPFLVAAYGSHPSVSNAGRLVYQHEVPAAQQMVWVDRQGHVKEAVGDSQPEIRAVSLSPDEGHIAMSVLDKNKADIWIYKAASGKTVQRTYGPADSVHPAWLPSGDRVAYSSAEQGDAGIYTVRADGQTAFDVLYTDSSDAITPSVSSDGRFLVFSLLMPTGGSHIMCQPLNDQSDPVALTQNEGFDLNPQISPDGNYIAFTSDRSGQWEVYVQAFPQASTVWQISQTGGTGPRWSPSQDELFFIQGDTLMAVKINTTDALIFGAPQGLFNGQTLDAPLSNRAFPMDMRYDVSTSGEQFLLIQNNGPRKTSLMFIDNWVAEYNTLKETL